MLTKAFGLPMYITNVRVQYYAQIAHLLRPTYTKELYGYAIANPLMLLYSNICHSKNVCIHVIKKA